MRRILIILGFIGLFLFPLVSYLAWSLGGGTAWSLILLLVALVMAFPFLRHNSLSAHMSFLPMGLLSFLIVFCFIKDSLLLFHIAVPIWSVYSLSLLTLIVGTWLAWRGPQIVELELPIQALPAQLSGLRILQISDLHVGPTIGQKYIQKVIRLSQEQSPDIIALTGDIGDGPAKLHQKDMANFLHLRPRLGMYYVPGNHEYYWNVSEWIKVLESLGAEVLINRGVLTSLGDQKILIAGVSDPVSSEKPDAAKGFQAQADFRLLLSHRPGIAHEAAAIGYDLMLAGHTHGGQFFPWTILVRFFHRHVLGLYRIDRMWLHVNSGTGSWGPLLRLGTIPEITLIKLIQA